AAVALILLLVVMERLRRRSIRVYGFLLVGIILGLSIASLLIHFTSGLRNYWHWTIQFAAERRTPALSDMLDIYAAPKLIVWLAFLAGGILLLWFARKGNRTLQVLSALLLSAPFVWPSIYLLMDSDASERADRLLEIWPVLLIVSALTAALAFRRRTGFALMLPWLLLAAIHGAFMSQQLWGSTYAIWPLFMILLAASLAEL